VVPPVGSSCCIFRSPAFQVDTTHASFGRQHRGFPPPPPNSRHSPPRPLGVGQIPDQLRSTRAVSSGAKPIAPRPRAHTRPAHGHAGRGIRTLPPVLPTPASTSTLRVVGQPHGAASAPSSRPLTCRRSGSGAAAAPLTPRIVTIVLMDFVLRCDMEVAESCERVMCMGYEWYARPARPEGSVGERKTRWGEGT
jgi:hypothetical protein